MQIENLHIETAYCITAKISALCVILGRQNDVVDEISQLNELLTSVLLDIETPLLYNKRCLSQILLDLELEKIDERIRQTLEWRKNGQKL